jgi:glucans biosynthesis protein C
MEVAATTSRAAVGRRQDLDLIRMVIVGGLIAFHTACIFVPGQFPVINQPTNFGMMAVVFFAKLWGMPLLFVVAGAGVWHSLRQRTPGGFTRERLRRLLPPLVVGIVIFLPPQVYFLLLGRGHDPGPYWRFLGRFLDLRLALGFPMFVRGAAPDGLFELGQLWFLYYLLLYSVLLLPVFLFLRRRLDQERLEWLTDRCRPPWGVVLLALPVVLVEVALGIVGPGSWHSYVHAIFLLYGFLIAADHRVGEAISRSWRPALLIGMAALPGLFIITVYDLGGADRLVGTDYDPWSLAFRLLKATAGTAWAIAIFGFVSSRIRRPQESAVPAAQHRAMRYANQAILPFYVLHQTPIVVIGVYVAQWRVGSLPKYMIIGLASLAATMLVYDLGIRRTRITRVLFGMPPADSLEPCDASGRPVAGDRW